MKKKAIIFDLDNTVYPVRSIGNELFAPLFELIKKDSNHADDLEKIKDDIMRRPFQLVAKDHQFSNDLTQKGMNLLKDTAYNGKIEPFPDYHYAKALEIDKFLVTTGFLKLQQSKVDGMKLSDDFKEIIIVDPATSNRSKKDVFEDIMNRYGYHNSEVLVVGDDLNSEIKAAQELSIEAVVYDEAGLHAANTTIKSIRSFQQLINFI